MNLILAFLDASQSSGKKSEWLEVVIWVGAIAVVLAFSWMILEFIGRALMSATNERLDKIDSHLSSIEHHLSTIAKAFEKDGSTRGRFP
jgi:hypothetical protein